MNVVFIIPTGIGCTIGGHAGDATPAANLIAQTCDKLIIHPNVVNASDINEMPDNALYVEGSILDRFLLGDIELQEVLSNKVLVVINPPIKSETVNAINAARATIGIDIEILELNTPMLIHGWVKDGIASGESSGVEDLIQQVGEYEFDALAVASPITLDDGVALDYFKSSDSRVNPWGGIEAKVSQQIALAINKPVAHAPIDENTDSISELSQLHYNTVVNPRMAAEVLSSCYLHCILKGLHKAPRIGRGINRSSVDCLVSPYGCIGRPHLACFKAGIPIIAVKENKTAYKEYDHHFIYVENYLEAAGVVLCLKAGISVESVLADKKDK